MSKLVAIDGSRGRKWGDVEVTLLACECLGTRAFSFLVETPGVALLVDPSAALGPTRGFPVPHPSEFAAIRGANARLLAARRHFARLEKTLCAFVSHYHQDHFKPVKRDCLYNFTSPEFAKELVRGTRLFAKDPDARTNSSQAKRGKAFRAAVRGVVEEFAACDGRRERFGDTRLKFSPPLPHGEEDGRQGHVVALCVEAGDERVAFAPDVQGPVVQATTDWLIAQQPIVAFLGGPPAHLRRFPLGDAAREVERLAAVVPELVVGHHVARSNAGLAWVASTSRKLRQRGGVRFGLVAEAFGFTPRLLERDRAANYAANPPNEAFRHWAALRNKERTPPPVDLERF
ncbi:MAG: hypothetical protein Kow0069_38560 [Promethearchaeota archaeon]